MGSFIRPLLGFILLKFNTNNAGGDSKEFLLKSRRRMEMFADILPSPIYRNARRVSRNVTLHCANITFRSCDWLGELKEKEEKGVKNWNKKNK